MISWFLIDLGNTVVKLAYERVIEAICRESSVERDELLDIFEMAGGYRDLERGAITFWEFHEFLSDRAGYRGSIRDFHEIWTNFFDGPMPGIQDLLPKIREKYRIAFLSNSNEVHAEAIPKQYAALFQREDRFIFSYRFKVAKPDPEMFHRALETIGAQAGDVVFIDDLVENVIAARGIGIRSFQFIDAQELLKQLQGEGLL
jgi:glucose-1-phosphatase